MSDRYIPALAYRWLTPLYDPVVQWTTRERAFKAALLQQARLAPGSRALDLACATATLTIAAQRMQPGAQLTGVDGDGAILERARAKAQRARVTLHFDEALSDRLPYADGSFDTVLSSLFFHHPNRDAKHATLRELDVRRREAFLRHPSAIAGAVPLLLDAPAAEIPDVVRDTPIVAYCLCTGQASSTRAALWLKAAGYTDVAVLEGGLPAWQAQGLPLAPIDPGDRRRVGAWMPPPRLPSATQASGDRLIAENAFLAGEPLPARRDLAVLFVDMVDSTQLLFTHEPEAVLRLVQAFMEVVVDIAVQHCGDVHDFEGDGAMLYFAGTGEALPAAFNLRAALAARRAVQPDLPHARFALDAGPLVVGHIGGRERRALSFIGPSVNAAARILKLAPPGGIVATQRIVDDGRRTDPDLAARFVVLRERQWLKGWQEPVLVHVAVESRADDVEQCHDLRS